MQSVVTDARWPQLERADKRAIIEQTVERITIGKDDIEIELGYLPSSSKLIPKMPHMATPAWHLCYLTLKAKKPKDSKYPKVLKTFGDRLRAKRLELGIYQREVAAVIGVTVDTVCYWENNRVKPSQESLPKIFRFLQQPALMSKLKQ